MHGPKLNRDWTGLRVRLIDDAANYHGIIAGGTTGVIYRYANGDRAIGFAADACKYCNYSPIVSGLSREDFTILTPRDEWKDTQGQSRRDRRRR